MKKREHSKAANSIDRCCMRDQSLISGHRPDGGLMRKQEEIMNGVEDDDHDFVDEDRVRNAWATWITVQRFRAEAVASEGE